MTEKNYQIKNKETNNTVQVWTIVVPMVGETFCTVAAETKEEAMDIIRENYDNIRTYENRNITETEGMPLTVMTKTYPIIDLSNDGYGDFVKEQLESNTLVVTDHCTGETNLVEGIRKDL